VALLTFVKHHINSKTSFTNISNGSSKNSSTCPSAHGSGNVDFLDGGFLFLQQRTAITMLAMRTTTPAKIPPMIAPILIDVQYDLFHTVVKVMLAQLADM